MSKKKFGFLSNHYFLTNVYWSICLYISIFHNYYVHPVSNQIYYIFFIGSFFFNITLFISKIKKIPQTVDVTTPLSLHRRRLLEVIAAAAVLPMAYANLKTILSGGEMWLMYKEYWEAREANNYLEEMLKQNIIQPLSFVLMATCMFTNYDKQGKYAKAITLGVAILLALLNMLMTAGGRTGLMQFSFFIFLSYVASRFIKNEKLLLKLKTKNLVIMSVIAICAFSIATIGRGSDDASLVLDVILERISLFPALFEGYYLKSDIFNHHTFGLSMFEQPVTFILYPFKLLGFDVNFERISAIVSEPMWTPADESMHNAAVSAYTFYIRDFGLLGVAIGPLLVGFIYNLLWRLCRKDGFLLVFYLSGVCATCLDSTYPFARGYFFAMLFAFIVRKFLNK